MIIRWGRRGHVAGAVTAVFVTAAAATSGIQQYQHRPDVRQAVRHITPEVVHSTTGLRQHHLVPAGRFVFRHLVAEDAPAPVPGESYVFDLVRDLVQPVVTETDKWHITQLDKKT